MNKEKDFDPDFLAAIFDRICALPFALTGHTMGIGPSKGIGRSARGEGNATNEALCHVVRLLLYCFCCFCFVLFVLVFLSSLSLSFGLNCSDTYLVLPR
jgi:hypothetical protein